MEKNKKDMQTQLSLNSYNCIKSEYNENEAKIYSNTNFEEIKNGKEENFKAQQHAMSTVYACPFKHEDYGIRCKSRSENLTEILNHFYHHHMGRVDLDGR